MECVISVLCMSAMLLETKYSICASNKHKINETQSYLADVVKSRPANSKLPPISDLFTEAKWFVAGVW